MRTVFFSLAMALPFLVSAPVVNAQASPIEDTFTTNLFLGSSGPQVIALQKLLNQDPDTRIASAGVGSPGNETDYFGLLTKAAVIRFQQKYASEVLTPAELTQASGFVGLYTRSLLNSFETVATVAKPSTPITASPTVSSPPPSASSQNPNLQNLGVFLSALNTLGAKQGLSSSELAGIQQAVLAEVATTTNLRAAFLSRVKFAPNTTAQNDSLLGPAMVTLGNAFYSIFIPERAQAQDDSEGTPFGGALLFPFYCYVSDTWLIAIEPLAPADPVLLTYEPESQTYASENIPITDELLGFEEPGDGICEIYVGVSVVELPSDGMIGDFVGSSPT